MMIESEHNTDKKSFCCLLLFKVVYLLPFCAMISFCKHLTGKTLSDWGVSCPHRLNVWARIQTDLILLCLAWLWPYPDYDNQIRAFIWQFLSSQHCLIRLGMSHYCARTCIRWERNWEEYKQMKVEWIETQTGRLVKPAAWWSNVDWFDPNCWQCEITEPIIKLYSRCISKEWVLETS